jgi:hypothetical protein
MKAFGQRAGPAMAELLSIGGDEIRKFQAQLEGAAGTAERIAAQQMDTLKGAFTELISATSGLAEAMGAEMIPALTEMTDRLKEYVAGWNAMTDAEKKHKIEQAEMGIVFLSWIVTMGIASKGLKGLIALVKSLAAGVGLMSVAFVGAVAGLSAIAVEFARAKGAGVGFGEQVAEDIAKFDRAFGDDRDAFARRFGGITPSKQKALAEGEATEVEGAKEDREITIAEDQKEELTSEVKKARWDRKMALVEEQRILTRQLQQRAPSGPVPWEDFSEEEKRTVMQDKSDRTWEEKKAAVRRRGDIAGGVNVERAERLAKQASASGTALNLEEMERQAGIAGMDLMIDQAKQAAGSLGAMITRGMTSVPVPDVPRDFMGQPLSVQQQQERAMKNAQKSGFGLSMGGSIFGGMAGRGLAAALDSPEMRGAAMKMDQERLKNALTAGTMGFAVAGGPLGALFGGRQEIGAGAGNERVGGFAGGVDFWREMQQSLGAQEEKARDEERNLLLEKVKTNTENIAKAIGFFK